MPYGIHRLTGAIGAAALAIVFAAAGVAFLAGSAAPAAAQSYLRGSSPQDGGKVSVAPGQVVLEFTEPILATGYSIVVLGPTGGIAYQQLGAHIAGDRLTQPLRPLGPAGEYRVEYRVVSAEGLPLTGEMRFTLTRPGPADGGAAARNVPVVPQLNVVTNALPWEWWTASALAAFLVAGVVLFGWRVTRGLD